MPNYSFMNQQEKIDWDLLNGFNEKFKYFTNLVKREKYATSDASGVTFDGRTFGIELKSRNQVLMDDGRLSGLSYDDRTYTADTEYIEAHKSTSMLFDYLYKNDEPLYINFLKDGTIIIYNLRKLSDTPKKQRVKIKSKGYEREEYEYRFFLPLKDAAIYKNGELIKRIGEEWNEQGKG